MTAALYPGTFDPPHLGHLDILQRASRIFTRVWVAVLRNPAKTPLFSPEERVRLLEEAAAGLPNVSVVAADELTVGLASRLGAQVIVRGLRAILDYDYEVQMALMNRFLAPEIETVFMLTSSQYAHVSSSLIKQLAAFGAPLDGLVPDAVQRALRVRLGAVPGSESPAGR